MLLLSPDMTTRWAVSNGPLGVPTKGASATATCRSVSAQARVEDGRAVLAAADAARLMPACGVFEISWDCGVESFATRVERVGRRYCSVDDVRGYGAKNNDGFDDESRYPEDDIARAVQQAEEAIDKGARRSFCERAIRVRLSAGLNELPVQDALSVDFGELVTDRQVRSTSAGSAVVTYGAELDARIREAAVRLAASTLRPRVGAENARGQSVEGVYTSYTLATGADGSWTGIPYVDAVIEEHRSHRVVVA